MTAMETSIFVAKILSLVYLSVGLGLLLNQSFYQKLFKDFMESPSVLYVGAIMALVVGFLLVTYHNIWVVSWVVLITILGWLALIKGIALLVIPNAMLRMTQSLLDKKYYLCIQAIAALILGLILGYYGFVA